MTGRRPLGWFTKSGPSLNTREILAEEGFLYDCDGINDDLPYYTEVKGKPWLVVPYAFDSNDGKYWRGGWSNGEQFFSYLKDSFDMLYKEGATIPRCCRSGCTRACPGVQGERWPWRDSSSMRKAFRGFGSPAGMRSPAGGWSDARRA